ncbi:MAG: cellulase (glycosyl hydrolase family 5) [Oscillospiraceae bacterium]|nr:cellulase (glycosyl hydrolase family 5) [Oscillospiraceae bacterium]
MKVLRKRLRLLIIIVFAITASGLMLSGCATDDDDASVEDSSPGTLPDIENPPPQEDEQSPQTVENIERERRRISIVNGQFAVDGGTKPIWINGVNIPWHRWNDFDSGYDEDWWDRHLAELRANSINSARIWINCNNDNGVVIIDSNGMVSGVKDEHWDALDRLFISAERHGIYLMPTFTSFDHFKSRNAEGWRNMVKSDAAVDSYIEHFTLPFLARYKENPFLWSIDLMNEPDWVHEGEENGQLAWEDISRFFARNAAAIRENSRDFPVLVTVGMAFPKYNADGSGYEGNKVSDAFLQRLYSNENARLDFWSPHYYDWVGQWYGIPFTSSPFGSRSGGGWGLCNSKPAILAEFSGNGSEGSTLTEDYLGLFNNGWQGAMAWSSNNAGTGDRLGGMDNIGAATRYIAELHPALVFPLG